mmetsp:Transcript_62678/g.174668  ORF Transcript_62678/g.174668 Transcript_62678/m.174668 type:complete len:258 (-) Transcript_62678:898-1671(-)
MSACMIVPRQIEHSSSPTPASHRCVCNVADSKLVSLSRTLDCDVFVVDQPWTAMPVDSIAPATPKNLMATVGATLDAATAAAALPLPEAAAPSAVKPTTALVTATPTCAPRAPARPAISSCAASEVPSAARSASPAESLASSHSLSSSATARVFQFSLKSWRLRSSRNIWSVTTSPAVVAPPTAAEPMPSATPMGGAMKRPTAAAMPKPALTVFPLFTVAHWTVMRLSSCRRRTMESWRMSCNIFAAAVSRRVVLRK